MTPIPSMFASSKQKDRYDRLLKHIANLGDTAEPVYHGNEPPLPYPDICNWAFMQVCLAMVGRPFIWLESDSIPLKRGWVDALAAEWQVAQSYGKKILWTTDTHPPFDLCTGIGVYSPDILIHLDFVAMKGDGFDGWINRNLQHLIHRTPLIQHSYGVYDDIGIATPHRNPKPRDNAVIFHKDQFQDLIP